MAALRAVKARWSGRLDRMPHGHQRWAAWQSCIGCAGCLPELPRNNKLVPEGTHASPLQLLPVLHGPKGRRMPTSPIAQFSHALQRQAGSAQQLAGRKGNRHPPRAAAKRVAAARAAGASCCVPIGAARSAQWAPLAGSQAGQRARKRRPSSSAAARPAAGRGAMAGQEQIDTGEAERAWRGCRAAISRVELPSLLAALAPVLAFHRSAAQPRAAARRCHRGAKAAASRRRRRRCCPPPAAHTPCSCPPPPPLPSLEGRGVRRL